MKKILQKFKVPTSGLLFQAAGSFVPLTQGKLGSGNLSGIFSSTDLTAFTQGLFKFSLALGAIIAVVRLMWAGYLYMGSDMWSSKSRAREIFVNVIIGILLLLSIWLILNLINPQLLNLQVLNSVRGAPVTGLTAPTKSGGPPYQCATQCPSYCDPNTGLCD